MLNQGRDALVEHAGDGKVGHGGVIGVVEQVGRIEEDDLRGAAAEVADLRGEFGAVGEGS